MFRKRLIMLQRISASQKQYIRVEERNGTIKNIPGSVYICKLYTVYSPGFSLDRVTFILIRLL